MTKTVLLLASGLFFSTYMLSGLHAKQSLPAIKNGTPWEITFLFRWSGCGSSSKHKGCVNYTEDHFSFVKGHSTKVEIKPNQTYTFKRGCINSCDMVNSITPYHPSEHYWMNDLMLYVKNNKNSLSCDGELCQWTVNRGTVPVLKYSNSKDIKTDNGFYWDVSQ